MRGIGLVHQIELPLGHAVGAQSARRQRQAVGRVHIAGLAAVGGDDEVLGADLFDNRRRRRGLRIGLIDVRGGGALMF